MENYISVESLTNGEQIALSAIEITAVPHISIINDGPNAEAEVTERYKLEMEGLLNEVYQSYKSISAAAGYSKDISVELMWTTAEVQNQPYKAQIRLFVLIRAIDGSASAATNTVAAFSKLFRSTLTLQKYDLRDIAFSELAPIINKTDDSGIKAIVKEEKAENLQNQLFPYCYAYDKIPLSNNDLSRIVNVLIDYPDCAVSMQLMPTILDTNETAEVDRISQALDTLNKGIADQGIGNISFTLAGKYTN
ncbi:MAG: hypothetical protein IJY73_03065, partial [Oscillospiraceae bacterium]|nr:hypothetical protein [Oscillospiraceae bacterium]